MYVKRVIYVYRTASKMDSMTAMVSPAAAAKSSKEQNSSNPCLLGIEHACQSKDVYPSLQLVLY